MRDPTTSIVSLCDWDIEAMSEETSANDSAIWRGYDIR